MDVLAQVGLVALGSAVGGLARWGVALLTARVGGDRWPWGTFAVNVTGCFFLGWLLAFAGGDERWRLLFGVGFAGAYTTFSTFGYEAERMLHAGDRTRAASYLGASVVVGLLAVRAGMLLGR